jgi:hypothetical protein
VNAGAKVVNAPLPPSRPAALTPATAAAPERATPVRRAPLDLSSFMVQRSGT